MSEYEKIKIINCKCGYYFVGNGDNELCDSCQLKVEVKNLFIGIAEKLKLDKFIDWLGRLVSR